MKRNTIEAAGAARTLLLAACLLPASLAFAATPSDFEWPDGQRAAVSLAYDDALDSQLDNAIPALDERGFHASFYLPLAADTLRRRLDEWRAAAARGHELGNHTLFHQCSGSGEGRDWVAPHRNLDTTTAARMRDQVLLANAMLTAIDGRHERTFAVPCGDAVAGDGNYVDLVAPDFMAIKLGFGAVVPDMAGLDPHAVTVEAPVGATGAQLIALVEEAGRRGTMVNFTFHGIGGDHLSVSAAAHAELLDYLSRHRDVYWVDTFIDIMRYVRRQQ